MISLCLICKNENLELLLKQIKRQTQQPDEIIIVDSSFSPWKFKKKNQGLIYHHLECSRSKARNLAAELSKNENLIFLDAGSEFDKNLIKEMAKCLMSDRSAIVAGRYVSQPKSFKEYVFSTFLNRDIAKDDIIYPSARNFGIKKKVFLRLHGFREDLNFAEDTEFFYRAKKSGIKFIKCTRAIVNWGIPGNFEYFKKIYNYAKGDIQSDIWWDQQKKISTHNIKHVLLLLRWLAIGTVLFLGFFKTGFLLIILYLYLSAVKNRIKFNKFHLKTFDIFRNVLIYVIIKLLTDFAVIFGFISGMF